MYKIYINKIPLNGLFDWDTAKAIIPILYDKINEVVIEDSTTGEYMWTNGEYPT